MATRTSSFVKFLQHVGGAYYVSVNSGYCCVDMIKWFQPFNATGDIKPTKIGVSLHLNEWSDLCNLVDVINKAYTSLGSVQPCYYEDDHNHEPFPLAKLYGMLPVPRQPQSAACHQHYSLD